MQQENTYELVSALFIKLLAVVYFEANNRKQTTVSGTGT